MTVSRRSFLASIGAATAIAVADVLFRPLTGLFQQSETEALMHRVVASFGDQTTGLPADATNVMGFLLDTVRNSDSELRITIKQFVVDQQKSYDLNQIFVDSIQERDYSNYDRANMVTPDALSVSAVISASNCIARNTRRGAGKHYAVFPDHILVWYAASPVDTPLCRMGCNVLIHPQHSEYFFRIRGIQLTDSDHKKLAQLRYNRIS
jgi:hypothetical protein